jgi:ADP-glucose pyrophosphorylase
MSTQMAKQAMYDKLAAQIAAAQSHLRTLKAEAEAKMAGAQIKMEITKMIAKHTTEEHAIQGKLAELKQAAGEKWGTLERDLHTQVTHLEKELKTLASKIKQS